MTHFRTLLITIVLLIATVAPSQTAVAAVDMSPVVAVTGTNGALYVKHTSAPGWTNLGGILIAAPAVAVVDADTTHYVGIGSNRMLYQRTDTTGWRRLTEIAYGCSEVTIVLGPDRTTVQGACTGPNAALYTFTFDGTVDRPVVQVLNKVTANGETIGRVSIGFDGIMPCYLFTGAEYFYGNPDLGIHHRNQWILDWDGLRRYYGQTRIVGIGVSPRRVYEAQQAEDGWLAVESNDGFYEIPSRTLGSPVLVENPDGTAELFVTGTNGVVYTQHVTPLSPTSWTTIPSATRYGPAAAAPPS